MQLSVTRQRYPGTADLTYIFISLAFFTYTTSSISHILLKRRVTSCDGILLSQKGQARDYLLIKVLSKLMRGGHRIRSSSWCSIHNSSYVLSVAVSLPRHQHRNRFSFGLVKWIYNNFRRKWTIIADFEVEKHSFTVSLNYLSIKVELLSVDLAPLRHSCNTDK